MRWRETSDLHEGPRSAPQDRQKAEREQYLNRDGDKDARAGAARLQLEKAKKRKQSRRSRHPGADGGDRVGGRITADEESENRYAEKDHADAAAYEPCGRRMVEPPLFQHEGAGEKKPRPRPRVASAVIRAMREKVIGCLSGQQYLHRLGLCAHCILDRKCSQCQHRCK